MKFSVNISKYTQINNNKIDILMKLKILLFQKKMKIEGQLLILIYYLRKYNLSKTIKYS